MLINTSATTFNVLGSLSDINNPYPVTAGDDFITFVFTAKAEGETAVELTVIDMTVREGEEDEVIIADTVDQRVEPQPTTEPSTTEAPAGDLTVTGSSNYSPAVDAQTVKSGDTVTVTFTAPEDANIVDLQWGMNYDKDLLEYTGYTTFTEDMLVNPEAVEYPVMGSVSNVNAPYAVTKDSNLVSFTFNAKGEGNTEVQFTVIDMTVRDGNEDTIIFKDKVDQREEPQQPTTEAPTTEEPTTEEATTEEPTTEPVTTEEPTTPAPTTEAPATEAPTTAPATEEPTEEPTAAPTEEPTTEAPATEEPTTEAPTSEAPTTEQPTTDAPTPEEPTTEAPTGEQPTTEGATAGTSSTDATSATSSASTSDSGNNGGSSSGSNGAVQTGNASMAIIILLVLVSATAGIYFVRKREK